MSRKFATQSCTPLVIVNMHRHLLQIFRKLGKVERVKIPNASYEGAAGGVEKTGLLKLVHTQVLG